MPRAKRVQNVNTYKRLEHGALSAIGATAVQLTATSNFAQSGVAIRADITNANGVWVGNSDVTAGTNDATDGFPILAGEVFIIPTDNTSNVWVRSTGGSQKIYWFLI